MTKNNNTHSSGPLWLLISLPPLLAVALWAWGGFPEHSEPTVVTYYTQLVVTAITLAAIPLLLKRVTRQRIGRHYETACLARMLVFCILAVLNIALYFHANGQTAFFYLAIIVWLAMFFAFPTKQEEP